MKRRKNDIQHILRFYFLSLIVAVLGMLSILFSIMQYQSYRNSALESIHRTCRNVAESIETNLLQLDAIVLNAISSDLTDEIKAFSDPEESEYEHFQERRQIMSLLLSHKGFDYSVRQLSIYSVSDAGFGFGDNTGFYTGFIESDWFQNTVAQNGRRYISVLDENRHRYLSVCRAYYDITHNCSGVIEGRKYFEEFFSAALNQNTQYGARVAVYDSDMQLIAANTESAERSVPAYLLTDGDPVSTGHVIHWKNDYTVCEEIAKGDFYAVMTVNTSELIRPLHRTFLIILLFFAIVLIVGSVLSGYMSRKISVPIRTIYHFLSDKDSMHSEKCDLDPTDIREIDRLTESINEYIEKSQEQTQTIIALKEQETQTQILALQSQMNPHFLYNSLASITEMARSGQTGPIIKLTENISDILRYISSNQEQLIPISSELDICDRYLECMQIRFGENLRYSFDIDDALWELMSPKLCIQLLIENAIKSVTRQSPPWEISVIGRRSSECWTIEVQDNGSGFDPTAMEKLKAETDRIVKTNQFPRLQIKGSGMLNIFIRFYLIDRSPFIFEYGNREAGGATVKIGRYFSDGGHA